MVNAARLVDGVFSFRMAKLVLALPHLHRDGAHPCPICTGTALGCAPPRVRQPARLLRAGRCRARSPLREDSMGRRVPVQVWRRRGAFARRCSGTCNARTWAWRWAAATTSPRWSSRSFRSKAERRLAWLGLAWLGLVWLGLAWLGLAWAALGPRGSPPMRQRTVRPDSAWVDARASTRCTRLHTPSGSRASMPYPTLHAAATHPHAEGCGRSRCWR